MDEVHEIKTEPELDLTEIEYIGVDSEDISNLLIKQEYEYEYVNEFDINAPANLEAKVFSQQSDSDDLTCKYCRKVLASKQSLRGHLRIHSGQFFKCDYIDCSRKFTRKADLKYHINTHTGQALFKCNLCPKTYSRKCLLRYHEKKHGIEPEQSEPWERLPIERYSYEDDLSNHTEIIHDETSYDESNQKLECHEELPSEDNLDNHLRKQSLRFGCNICSVKFSKKSHFDLHLITHINEPEAKEHTVTKATAMELISQRILKQNIRISEVRINHLNYQCYRCRQAFHDKESLEEHMKVHTDVIICGWCDEKFPTRISFQNHLPCNKNPRISKKKKRNGDRSQSLVCSYCSKKFASVYTFAAHQKVHTGKNLLNCTTCDKQFHTKSLLKQHELTHCLDRPWCCSFCGMRFKMSRTLEEHERIHRGIKRFECKICRTKFMQSSTLWRHNKLVHEKVILTDMKE